MGTVEPGFFTNSDPGRFIGFEEYSEGFGMNNADIPGISFPVNLMVGDFGSGNYNGPFPFGRYNADGSKFGFPLSNDIRIDFTLGFATRVSLLSSNEVGISVSAYDSSDTLLDRAPTTGISNSTYNPPFWNGSLDKFTVSSPNISYIVISGIQNSYIIDDIVTDAPAVPTVSCIFKRDEGIYTKSKYCYLGEGIFIK